jgi:hypothetical protein
MVNLYFKSSSRYRKGNEKIVNYHYCAGERINPPKITMLNIFTLLRKKKTRKIRGSQKKIGTWNKGLIGISLQCYALHLIICTIVRCTYVRCNSSVYVACDCVGDTFCRPDVSTSQPKKVIWEGGGGYLIQSRIH